jgi:acyl dehydratase
MPLDPTFIGRSYPPTTPYEVNRDRIGQFARAIGDTNPAYFDVAAAQALGHPDVVAPPTFAIVMTLMAADQVAFDPALGLDYSRVVHGEQRFSHTRPIHAGDKLTVVVHVDNIRSVAGSDLLSTRAEVSTVDGDHICSAFSVLVSRGAGGDPT